MMGAKVPTPPPKGHGKPQPPPAPPPKKYGMCPVFLDGVKLEGITRVSIHSHPRGVFITRAGEECNRMVVGPDPLPRGHTPTLKEFVFSMIGFAAVITIILCAVCSLVGK